MRQSDEAALGGEWATVDAGVVGAVVVAVAGLLSGFKEVAGLCSAGLYSADVSTTFRWKSNWVGASSTTRGRCLD